jgi:hypothetical protein
MRILNGYTRNLNELISETGFDLKKAKQYIRDVNLVGWGLLIITTILSYSLGIFDEQYFWLYLAGLLLYGLLYVALYLTLAGGTNPNRRSLIIISLFLYIVGGAIPTYLIKVKNDYNFIFYLYFAIISILLFQIIFIINLRIASRRIKERYKTLNK